MGGWAKCQRHNEVNESSSLEVEVLVILAEMSKSNSVTFKDFQGPYEGYSRRTIH